jgi:mannose-6-phosphate isomerase-like protein (cupin superfamily)
VGQRFSHYRAGSGGWNMDLVTNATTPPGSAPFTLDRRTVLHLAPDQSMATLSMDEDSWARADSVPELRDGRIACVFTYDASWTWWERHPVGVELVFVLGGAAVFHLRDAAGERTVALTVGEGLLVPEMVWHRADVAEPTTMLFVTPSPARTEHRDA